MGKTESKQKKCVKASLNCNVKSQIQCPICYKILNVKITYGQLNMHLKQCDILLNSKLKDENKSHKNLGLHNYEDMLDQRYVNLAQNKFSKNNIINNSEPRRTTHKKSSFSSGDLGTINDFQLVIDYNNTKNPDLYEEKLKNEGNKGELYDKYSQLRKFLINKKNLMNFDMDIECKSYKELFSELKNCNIYYNTKFILKKNDGKETGKITNPKILSLNLLINKYIDSMIKNNIFYNIDDTIFFQFNSNQVDYEMIGIILSALFIYPEIKLRYYIPVILCKILINQRIELNDIQNINNELYLKLYNLSKEKKVVEKGLVYFYEGNELLIDGKNIKVDNKNVFDYIEKILNYEMKKYKENINIIKKNLYNLIPKKYIFDFNGDELYRIVNRTL